jgi:thioredoxin reductase (NADPH)
VQATHESQPRLAGADCLGREAIVREGTDVDSEILRIKPEKFRRIIVEDSGADVVVVGGGNSAGQGAVHLAKYARNVHLLIRKAGLAESMSRYLIRRIEETPNIHLHIHSEITRLFGDGKRLQAVETHDRESGNKFRLEAPWVFLFLGARPCTSWLDGTLALDENGFIKTGSDLKPQDLAAAGHSPSLFESSLPRVYAVGDVRSGSVKRCASAVGEGSIVVQFIHRALSAG